MDFLSTSALLRQGCLKTSSRLKVFWLTSFRGYQVENVVEQPHRYVLGRLTYQRSWVLRPPRH